MVELVREATNKDGRGPISLNDFPREDPELLKCHNLLREFAWHAEEGLGVVCPIEFPQAAWKHANESGNQQFL